MAPLRASVTAAVVTAVLGVFGFRTVHALWIAPIWPRLLGGLPFALQCRETWCVRTAARSTQAHAVALACRAIERERSQVTDHRAGHTAIGCRVKSGWATAVLVAGPASAPRVLDRRRLELSDAAIPATIQSYHADFGTEQTDAATVRRLSRIIAQCAARSFRDLIRAYRAMGCRPRRIGLVVGSTVDPATIAQQHLRAHASEGKLFRTVLESAAARVGVRSTVMVERELYRAAARALGGSLERMHRVATALGGEIGPPWRVEDKAAAVAGWLLLARRS